VYTSGIIVVVKRDARLVVKLYKEHRALNPIIKRGSPDRIGRSRRSVSPQMLTHIGDADNPGKFAAS
jgi:hypothetical protein